MSTMQPFDIEDLYIEDLDDEDWEYYSYAFTDDIHDAVYNEVFDDGE